MSPSKKLVNRPPQRPGRSPVNVQKYAEIVEVASRLFARQGFAATSLQDIAVEVGVLKGSLYHYIASKEELLAEVVRGGQLGLRENIELCDYFADDPLEQIVAFAYGHVRLNATSEKLQRGIVFQRDGDKLSPEGRAEVVRNRDEYDEYLRRILVEGQDKGLIDPDVQPRICGFAVLGVITSYMRWYRPEGPLSADDLGREFAGFALAAVRNHLTAKARGRFDIVDPVVERCREILAKRAEPGTEHVA